MVLSLPDAVSIGWLNRLSGELDQRAPELQRCDDYYRGVQGKRFVPTKTRELFEKLFQGYCENFCGVVVDAVEERLDIEGFRFPTDDVEDPDATDSDAWRIWQDNQLDVFSQIAHQEALVKRLAYVLVSPFESERVGTSPLITIEDALQTIVACSPGSSTRVAGMKRWDDDTIRYATLYFPDRVEKWQAKRDRMTPENVGNASNVPGWDMVGMPGSTSPMNLDPNPLRWERRIVEGENWPLPHSLGVVPLVPLVNRPILRPKGSAGPAGDGESEIAQVISIQNAINTLAFNELVASDAAAFPQKWATGIEVPIDPETKKPLPPWQPDIERILSTAVPDARFGSFTAADLNQWGDAIDRRVKRIASVSRTPYHFFLDHGGQPPSGSSLRGGETGLVKKARRRTRQYGERWEEVMRLAFRALGDPRAGITNAQTVWADVEVLTESEHIDALAKKRASLKVPLRQLWEDANYSPSQIAKFIVMLQAEKAELEGTIVEPSLEGGQTIVQDKLTP